MASSALTASQNADLAATTRELWKKTVVPQVFLKMPLYAKLLDMNQVTWKTGDKYVFTADTAESDSVGQAYATGQPMTAGRATTLTRPWVTRKKFQIPIRYDVDEELDNDGGSTESVIDLAALLVKKAQRAAKILLYKMAYSVGSTDSGVGFQSVIQALNHDATYAHTTRATTVTNPWFQGASLAATYADQDTARTCSISLVRQMFSVIMAHVDDSADVMLLCGPDRYLTLKAQVDASTKTSKEGTMAKYGFASFMIDDQIEVVQDYFLTAANLPVETAAGYYPAKWMFMLNARDWHLMLHPARSFALKPFTWQGDRTGGADEWLSRILVAGNLLCERPSGSIWLSDVT